MQRRLQELRTQRKDWRRDEIYRALMLEHRKWNCWPLAGLLGLAAGQFGKSPLWAIPILIVGVPLGFALIDRAVGWDS